MAGRNGTAGRSPTGPALRHLAPALPPPPPLPVGTAAGAGRAGAPLARRVRRRRARSRLPLPPPAERPPARLRRLVVLAVPGHRPHRDRPGRDLGRRGGRHLARDLARARRRGAPLTVDVGWPARPGRPLDGALAPHHRRGGRPGRHPVGHRPGSGRHDRRGRTRARAHAPRRGVLRQPRRHLGDRARAPGALRTAAHLPPPPPGGDGGAGDRGRPAHPPGVRGGRPAAGHPGRAAAHAGRRRQGEDQGGRPPSRAGGQLARRRLLAARPRGGRGPHPGAPDPPGGGHRPVRCRTDRPPLGRHRPGPPSPAPHLPVPAD